MNPVIDQILRYAREEYGTEPDNPWQRTPDAKVLRHGDNKKWYGLIFSATERQLGIGDSDRRIDILNVKCDSNLSASLRSKPGILPGYHMNHVEWTTLLLDGTVPMEIILNLLNMSYGLTAPKKKMPFSELCTH